MEKDGVDKLILGVKLVTETCALEHKEKIKATDYIYQQFTFFELVIPICRECIDRLYNDDWILLYCIECCNSKWIYKPDSNHKLLYEEGEHIRWIKVCPVCHNENTNNRQNSLG